MTNHLTNRQRKCTPERFSWRHTVKQSWLFVFSHVSWKTSSRGSYSLADMVTSDNTLIQVHRQTCHNLDLKNSTCRYYITVNKHILITANKCIHTISPILCLKGLVQQCDFLWGHPTNLSAKQDAIWSETRALRELLFDLPEEKISAVWAVVTLVIPGMCAWKASEGLALPGSRVVRYSLWTSHWPEW